MGFVTVRVATGGRESDTAATYDTWFWKDGGDDDDDDDDDADADDNVNDDDEKRRHD